ncbi:MAG: DoxX family protein [Gammaproteobacteria bacterium]|nr:DoxX family protein [Gammaproteobacteria bacterium]
MKRLQTLDWLAPLAIRLYLAPVFWVAGWNKWHPERGFDFTARYFDRLGYPLPDLMAFLATATEIGGAIALLLGLATRLACIPLMFVMAIAITTVHWKNGWQITADPRSPFPGEDIDAARERLGEARRILREQGEALHGDSGWFTEFGSIVILNNGVALGVTYFVMLLALFYLGGGRYLSLDHYIARAWRR